jgi:hypothetical protein
VLQVLGYRPRAHLQRMGDYGKIEVNYRQNYDRLVHVKRAYDPGNLFHFNQNTKP